MKQIGAINVDDAPLGMRIYKNGRYYKVAAAGGGKKKWQALTTRTSRGGAAAVATVDDLRPEQHSWAHHHAPMYQVFNDYVCLKKDTLGELRDFLLVVSNLGK